MVEDSPLLLLASLSHLLTYSLPLASLYLPVQLSLGVQFIQRLTTQLATADTHIPKDTLVAGDFNCVPNPVEDIEWHNLDPTLLSSRRRAREHTKKGTLVLMRSNLS